MYHFVLMRIATLAEYLTEQEQVELLKKWIKQYSFVVLTGVLIAIALITGWRYYTERHTAFIMRASAVYDRMLMARFQNNAPTMTAEANTLTQHYPHTVYSEMAQFAIANDLLTNRTLNPTSRVLTAESALMSIIKHSHVPAFRQIARIRLARIYIAEKRSDKAINLLNKIEDKTFSGYVNEVVGDAYFAAGNRTKAREAYGTALNEIQNADTTRPLLRMKYDDLAS